MLRYYSLLLLLLATPTFVQAGPFLDSGTNKERDHSCKYSEIYSGSQKTFIILNLVERLSFSKKKLKNDRVFTVGKFLTEVLKDCKSDQKIEISKIDYSGEILSFEYGSGRHSVEWLNYKGSHYTVYKKLYGTYKNEPLMVIKFNDKTKDFTRITGRYGPESSIMRYTFFFNKEEKVFSKKIELESKNRFEIKSLKSIYGEILDENLKVTEPIIKVGVIGTGLDYNHPGLAKHLAYRSEMEEGLQKLEALEEFLRVTPYVTSRDYETSMLAYNKLKPKVGFPNWMDQALRTKTPYDVVLINKKRSRNKNKEHETRVISRLLRTGGDVEVHFARRSMGSIDDFNVIEVVENFAKKGVRLINLSFGSKCGGFLKEEKMWGEVFALYPKIVFVVSAGNSGLNTFYSPFCPAKFSQIYNNVISVTALDGDGQLAVYYNIAVNYGLNIDLAIKSDNLKVLIPYREKLKWENNANGATSLAAAEVSRILTEATLEGLEWNAQTVKDVFVETSVYSQELEGLTKNSSEVDEAAFKKALKKYKYESFIN